MTVNYLAGGWLKISNFPAALAGEGKKKQKKKPTHYLVEPCFPRVF